ncbi:MAG: peptidoglycan-binding domain-containing protein [Woeseia sp.]
MRKQMNFVLTSIVITATTAGCSSMANDSTYAVGSNDAASMVELQAANRRVSELESRLAESDRRLSASQAADTRAISGNADVSLFPPNPKPGQCYARVLTPAKYRTISERVLVRDASERIEILPARYTTADETVLVKEASTRLEVVPAVYETISEQVLTKPASKKVVEIAAEYRTEIERVVDQPAHTAWKKGPAAKQTANVLSQTTTDTGELMCLVEVPATYKNIEKRVLVRPARTTETVIPAEYRAVTKRVVKTPATTREVAVPAQYDTIQVTKLAAQGSEKRIAVPASYENISRSEMVAAEKMDWRQVMCEVNMTASNVRALQKALQDEGYYSAGIDGVFGNQTLRAAQSYAAKNGLATGSNYVPMEVIKKLGIDI